MSIPLNWGDITHKVENSGVQEEQIQKENTKKRNMLLRNDWENQIQELNVRRRTEEQEKPHLRADAEKIDKNAYEKERKLKDEAKEREYNYRNQNMEIIEKNYELKRNTLPNKYTENPITSCITKNFDDRNKKSREINLEYNQINNKLIEEKAEIQKNRYNEETLQRQKFENSVEETFKKKDEERYAFKKACLDGRKNKIDRYNTMNDSLEKEYAMYLNEQIAQKRKHATNQPINFERIKVEDQIQNNKIENLNQKVELQNSSPAYLGRIPINHDRQKQLSYLDNQLKFRERTKTENPSVYIDQNPEQIKDERPTKTNQYSSYIEPKREINLIVNLNGGQRDLQAEVNKRQENVNKSEKREFRQFNILTGSHIVRNHFI